MTDQVPSGEKRENIQDGDHATPDDAQAQLGQTADGWRSVLSPELEDSADEVASGADRAAQQSDYGREGS